MKRMRFLKHTLAVQSEQLKKLTDVSFIMQCSRRSQGKVMDKSGNFCQSEKVATMSNL